MARLRPLAFVFAAALLALPLPGRADADGARSLNVVASASGDGELTMCGCKKNPLGGLSRRATLVGEARQAGPAVLVEAGNFAEADGYGALEKTRKIWDVMARLGYDAATPGDRELLLGRAGIRELELAHPEIPFVSANITDKAGALVWPESIVLEREGLRVAVTGVTGEAPYARNVARGAQAADDFAFTDPAEALRRVLPGLRERADVVIALIQDGPADVRRLVEEVPGCDVAVAGFKPGYAFQPDRVGSTLLLRGGEGGKYLPMLTLTLDGSGGILDYSGESKPLNKGVAPDPGLEAEINTWLDGLKAREKAEKL